MTQLKTVQAEEQAAPYRCQKSGRLTSRGRGGRPLPRTTSSVALYFCFLFHVGGAGEFLGNVERVCC